MVEGGLQKIAIFTAFKRDQEEKTEGRRCFELHKVLIDGGLERKETIEEKLTTAAL